MATMRELARANGSRLVMSMLLVSACLVAFPPLPAGAATTKLYLVGGEVPNSNLSTVAPTGGGLPNYDPGRDGEPGLLLSKTDGGWGETDAVKYQQWTTSSWEASIDGPVSLTFWSAMKDFDADKGGKVQAYLLNCNVHGKGCQLIDSAGSAADPWATSGTWSKRTIDFGNVDHQIRPGRSLVLKIVVANDSGDDMWFAYGTTSYPSVLVVGGVETTTTTTTTTTPATTTTTKPTTTTTTTTPKPTTTTSTTSTTSTTTIPGTPTTTRPTSTTSTSITTATAAGPGVTSTTTTLAAGAPSGTTTTTVRGEGGATVQGPSGDGEAPIESQGDPSASDALLSLWDDSAMMGVGASSHVGGSDGRVSLNEGFIANVELVIPPWARSLVTSPLMVLGFVIAALTDSGRQVLFPTALLVIGMALVLVESKRLRRLILEEQS